MKKMLIGVALLFAAGFFGIVASTASLTGVIAWAGFMGVGLFAAGVIVTGTQAFDFAEAYDSQRTYDRKERALLQRERELAVRKAERISHVLESGS